ncbi:MAG: hypothetical protein CMG60_08160 [Candidatus Marinimicrobia bacterium]|nr:hypothetical protein [Candidatus Neomarinimicrobiota bacterium]
MVYIKNIILFSFLIFISCDKDGTIVHNEPLIHQSSVDGRDYSVPNQDITLEGDGCSGDNLCYDVYDVYYDFSNSNGFEFDYYKFNYAQIQEGAPHDVNTDVLTLKSFNNTWLLGVPGSSISDNSDNQVLIVDNDGESYSFTTQSIIEQVDDPAYCTHDNDPVECDDIIKYTGSEISLLSSQLENIEEIKWNPSVGKYNIDGIQSDQFSQSYLYVQPYEEIYLVSVIDPEQYDIFGDLILVDQTETINRQYDIEALLDNGDAIEVSREARYYTQYSYLDPIDALVSQENTDCNDNYQVDATDEWVIFDGYYDSPSFERWCTESPGGVFNLDSTVLCNSSCEFIYDCASLTTEDCEASANCELKETEVAEVYLCEHIGVNACNSLNKSDCNEVFSCSLDDPVEIDCSSYENPEDCASGNECTWDLSNSEPSCKHNCTFLTVEECNISEDYDCILTDSGESELSCDVYDDFTCDFINTVSSLNMEDFCWEYYDGNETYGFSDDNRLTGNCYTTTNPNSKIQYLSGDLQQYQLTFCDRGNNYYDPAEYFIDQYPDGVFGENLNQGVEPFEDRNCNDEYDDAEIILTGVSEGDWSDDCSGYVSSRLGEEFCDKGNGIWDREEEKHPICLSGSEGTQGVYNVDYQDYQCMFELADKDDKIIVDYLDQSNPVALTSIFPRASFYDTGADGCYDIFEDGLGGCLCEFNNCSDTIPSCEDYLTSLGLWNGDQVVVDGEAFSYGNEGESYFTGDVNQDGEITAIDIALLLSENEESPYNYGECNNGYSGTEEDCCIHQGCDWNSESGCTFDNGDAIINCPDFSWEQRLDPNCDNYQTLDAACSSSSETEFNGAFEGIYIDSDGNTQDTGGLELSHNYINYSLAPNDDEEEVDSDYIISMEEYCALNESEKLSYSSHYYDEPTIVSRYMDYNDDGSEGGDVMKIIRHENYSKDYKTKAAIIESRNSLRSHPIIDQINFDDENLSVCFDLEVSNCEDNSEYTWCSWDSENDVCEVDNIYALNTYNSMINNHNIVKTEFINSSGQPDYDYMVYAKTDKDIVKMIHPYYHFGSSDQLPNDLDDFDEDQFWQGINLVPDTVIYSYDGKIVAGQYFHSLYSVDTEQAKYKVAKEYAVYDTTATLVNKVDDPKCKTFITQNDCQNADEFWCDWNADLGDNGECYTAIQQSNITDCLLVSRIVETTAIGTNMSFQLKSDSYFKSGYGLVKEDLFIHWDDVPWLESSFTPISSIEYVTPASGSSPILSTSQGNIFFDYEIIDVEDFENIEDFNYNPFKVTHTLGVQRIEYPINF